MTCSRGLNEQFAYFGCMPSGRCWSQVPESCEHMGSIFGMAFVRFCWVFGGQSCSAQGVSHAAIQRVQGGRAVQRAPNACNAYSDDLSLRGAWIKGVMLGALQLLGKKLDLTCLPGGGQLLGRCFNHRAIVVLHKCK